MEKRKIMVEGKRIIIYGTLGSFYDRKGAVSSRRYLESEMEDIFNSLRTDLLFLHAGPMGDGDERFLRDEHVGEVLRWVSSGKDALLPLLTGSVTMDVYVHCREFEFGSFILKGSRSYEDVLNKSYSGIFDCFSDTVVYIDSLFSFETDVVELDLDRVVRYDGSILNRGDVLVLDYMGMDFGSLVRACNYPIDLEEQLRLIILRISQISCLLLGSTRGICVELNVNKGQHGHSLFRVRLNKNFNLFDDVENRKEILDKMHIVRDNIVKMLNSFKWTNVVVENSFDIAVYYVSET